MEPLLESAALSDNPACNWTVAGDGPAANDNLPFQLVSLGSVNVERGVMCREQLNGFDDLVEGDHWSFEADLNTTPAEIRDTGNCVSVHLAKSIEIGPKNFVIGAAHGLVLMSERGTVLRCRFVTNRDRNCNGYLLLPPVFDTTQAYELIAKNL